MIHDATIVLLTLSASIAITLLGFWRFYLRRHPDWREREVATAERRDIAARAARRRATRPSSLSGVPVTAPNSRELVQVIENLVAVRPVNWDDIRDPQQRAAWRAADVVLTKHGKR